MLDKNLLMNINADSKIKHHPLLSWDISGNSYRDAITLASKKDELIKLNEFSKKYAWDMNWRLELLQPYDALVLTDAQQIICWVSGGFQKMTGYSNEFAIGRTPKFLQGKNTSFVTREMIKKKLHAKERFEATVTNYRQDGEPYECRVNILPLLNYDNDITHFIAFERELHDH